MQTGDRDMLKYLMAVLASGLAFAPASWAVEALSSEELMAHCDQYHNPEAEEDRIFCVRYIQGFIDGAVATDERVMLNVAKEFDAEDSYSERATRTRIGSRLERMNASIYAEYCLGDPVPLAEVVGHVVDDAQDDEQVAKIPLARELVYQTLRAHYPCAKAD
jgi:hypothetical protein